MVLANQSSETDLILSYLQIDMSVEMWRYKVRRQYSSYKTRQTMLNVNDIISCIYNAIRQMQKHPFR